MNSSGRESNSESVYLSPKEFLRGAALTFGPLSSQDFAPLRHGLHECIAGLLQTVACAELPHVLMG